jgi:hypothetical protein
VFRVTRGRRHGWGEREVCGQTTQNAGAVVFKQQLCIVPRALLSRESVFPVCGTKNDIFQIVRGRVNARSDAVSMLIEVNYESAQS